MNKDLSDKHALADLHKGNGREEMPMDENASTSSEWHPNKNEMTWHPNKQSTDWHPDKAK